MEMTTTPGRCGESSCFKDGWQRNLAKTQVPVVSVVVHCIHFPVSALKFVMPMVAHLNQHGFDTELWFEKQPAHQDTVRQILVPHRHLDFDLTPRPVTFLARLARYRRQLRAAKPSVLHAHQTRASLIPLLAASLERV